MGVIGAQQEASQPRADCPRHRDTIQTAAKAEAFRAFVGADDFPCVGAKAALNRDDLVIYEHGPITSPACDVDIWRELSAYIDALVDDKFAFQSMAVIFDGPCDLSEREFETALWRRLQCLHNLDVVTGEAWAEDVASDPDEAHFSMSLLGEPFFIIGLHPNASRPARRFDYPAMVFNSHAQFERLRADGRFERMQKTIRKRDQALAGSVNPMLSDFGAASEARQYSGRRIEGQWKCPFVQKEPDS